MRRLALVVVLVGALSQASGAGAQMWPGAQVEKTYGVGLPRDMVNADLMTSNAISARRWYASGSSAFQTLVKATLQDFGVSIYRGRKRAPAVGLAASERAFLKILDETGRMTMQDLHGPDPLPHTAVAERKARR
ncbi:hypothetical protein [Phenylobacterium immobile]|uniref:hypothetical protein n=1 Tax=Phenylobacterium immobile TaxID=21 RepID=UPI000AE14526|nr:hypothetical protein [Phenylobacterium immobile]